jgi:hypothetical protein
LYGLETELTSTKLIRLEALKASVRSFDTGVHYSPSTSEILGRANDFIRYIENVTIPENKISSEII